MNWKFKYSDLSSIKVSSIFMWFFFLLICFYPLSLYGQECIGNYFLTSQTAIDNFNCTSVTGTLGVGDNYGGNITNLDGLSELVSVGEDFYISSNYNLTDVDGLAALTSVVGSVIIGENSLKNVNGLASLTMVEGSLLFYDEEDLANVDGLAALTSVGGGLSFYNVDALTDVDGLSALTSIGGDLDFTDNQNLADVDGLAALSSVGGALKIRRNNNLMKCCGLFPLLSFGAIGSDIYISDNLVGCNSVEEIINAGPCTADNINDFVSFDPAPSTYSFSTNTKSCPSGYFGKFKFDARLTNTSDQLLSDLTIDIDQLTSDNRVLPYPIEDMNLWNKLGSTKQIRNSKIGPDGTVDGGQFVSGVHGRAYSARYDQDELVRFPNAVMPIEAGTIEFWAKLKNVPYEIDWGHNPHFVWLNDDVGHSAYFIGFNGNDGAGNGGLVGCVGGGGSDSYYYGGITTGTGAYAQQWNYEDILGAGKVEDWHHYALVWDKNGIVGVDNGQRVVAVYLNGHPVSKQWGRFPGSELIPIESGELSMVRNWLSQGKVAMDNIKVWSFAKTDFSDRFVEGGSLGEGESFKIRNLEDYTDGVLSPGESVDVPFTVCLTDTEPFQFYVDVLGMTLNLNEGLVAYYPFSGNADDESGNRHHGTVYGAVLTEDIFGEPNSAYSFNGTSDYISIPVDINPELMPQLTMTAWARADNDPPSSWPVMQVISHDNGGYDRSFGIDFRGGGAGWSAFSGSGGVLGYHPVEIGKWVFLAVVYDQDAETVTLHVNGSKYKEKGRLGSGYNYCSIGDNSIPHMYEYFAGVIDELRIYNRALSEDEIEALYHFGE